VPSARQNNENVTASGVFDFGANRTGESVQFRVWAPHARQVELRLVNGPQLPMQRDESGVFALEHPARAGDRYFYIVDVATPVPDPVSRLLPEGVHGPTEIVDPNAFRWSDHDWRGLPLEQYIIYELHVGTFTPEGNFDAVCERLEYLRDLGVTVIELMPVAAFPGTRNWGYDGVSPFAVQASYGGPQGLQRLVNAAHACGLAVMLDVVYNHLGNEGNYLPLFAPYFTARHKTPWGDAINYDQPGCEGVRRYVVGNALYWIREYHLDGLRLDAVQTIHDSSPQHIVFEVQENVQELARELGRTVSVIAETDENDPNYVVDNVARTPSSASSRQSTNLVVGGRFSATPGFGEPKVGTSKLDAIWSDDFHHAVHAFLTGERRGYYQDFGSPEQIAKALNEGFVFQGEYFNFWQRPRGKKPGAPPDGMMAAQHVICLQNHDQVGNRAQGERLTSLVPRGARMAAAALLLLAPATPLLFMGQEYDEPAPFQFFTSYSDPELKRAVSEGRRREFKDFDFRAVPDPEDPETFERSRLNWELALRGNNPVLKWYRDLLALRKELYRVDAGDSPAGTRRTCAAQWHEADGLLTMQIPRENPHVVVAALLRPAKDADRRREIFARNTPAQPYLREQLCFAEDGYEVRVFSRF
jgi:maltooligosyltrehalose trehalohydrolase